jgi:hypothetical protein
MFWDANNTSNKLPETDITMEKAAWIYYSQIHLISLKMFKQSYMKLKIHIKKVCVGSIASNEAEKKKKHMYVRTHTYIHRQTQA